jgi:hypothetical protein
MVDCECRRNPSIVKVTLPIGTLRPNTTKWDLSKLTAPTRIETSFVILTDIQSESNDKRNGRRKDRAFTTVHRVAVSQTFAMCSASSAGFRSWCVW